MTNPLHEPIRITAELDAGNEIKTTTCYMCACRCGIKVHVRGDEVRYIEGNPAHPSRPRDRSGNQRQERERLASR